MLSFISLLRPDISFSSEAAIMSLPIESKTVNSYALKMF